MTNFFLSVTIFVSFIPFCFIFFYVTSEVVNHSTTQSSKKAETKPALFIYVDPSQPIHLVVETHSPLSPFSHYSHLKIINVRSRWSKHRTSVSQRSDERAWTDVSGDGDGWRWWSLAVIVVMEEMMEFVFERWCYVWK